MSDVPPSPETLLWTAQRIADQHTEPPNPFRVTGVCARCTEDGCSQLSWARQALRELPAAAA